MMTQMLGFDGFFSSLPSPFQNIKVYCGFFLSNLILILLIAIYFVFLIFFLMISFFNFFPFCLASFNL